MDDEIRVGPATEDQVLEIALTLRPADIREAQALGEDAAESVIDAYLAEGETMVVTLGCKPVCVFGCARQQLIGKSGTPWMMGAEELDDRKHAVAIARRSKPYHDQLIGHYDHLQNHVSADNTVAVRWLRWLGYTLEAPQPVGPFGAMFHRFYKRRPPCAE